MEVHVTVKGTKEDYLELDQIADIRQFNYSSSKWSFIIRLANCENHTRKDNIRYRYYRISTIKGLIKKLKSNNHIIERI